MSKIIYLTIDDAPSSHLSEKVDFLLKNHIPAIFYCRGEYMKPHIDQVAYAIQKGYLVGNHSYSHPHFSDIDLIQAREEIVSTEDLINTAYQLAKVVRPYKLFRFPYLDRGEKHSNAYVADLQGMLKDLGFNKIQFPHLNYTYCQERGYLDSRDACFTFDAKEYASFSQEYQAKHSLYGVDDYLTLMAKNAPEKGLGLVCSKSSDVVLLHDFETTHHLFEPMINQLIAWKVDFRLPSILHN